MPKMIVSAIAGLSILLLMTACGGGLSKEECESKARSLTERLQQAQSEYSTQRALPRRGRGLRALRERRDVSDARGVALPRLRLQDRLLRLVTRELE